MTISEHIDEAIRCLVAQRMAVIDLGVLTDESAQAMANLAEACGIDDHFGAEAAGTSHSIRAMVSGLDGLIRILHSMKGNA